MEIFDIGAKILLLASFLFFLIFFILCGEWAKSAHPGKRFTIGFLVSMLYTFLVFLLGFLYLAAVAFIFKYFPSLTDALWKFLF